MVQNICYLYRLLFQIIWQLLKVVCKKCRWEESFAVLLKYILAKLPNKILNRKRTFLAAEPCNFLIYYNLIPLSRLNQALAAQPRYNVLHKEQVFNPAAFIPKNSTYIAYKKIFLSHSSLSLLTGASRAAESEHSDYFFSCTWNKYHQHDNSKMVDR